MRIDMTSTPGAPLPPPFATSSFAFWSDQDALAALLSLPGPLGFVRWGVGLALRASTSHADYLVRLRAVLQDPTLGQLLARGATLLMAFENMPAWLSASTDQTPSGSGHVAYETFWPKDWDAWRLLAADTARVAHVELGLSASALRWEFWNEPSLPDFFGFGLVDEAARRAMFAAMYREWAQAMVEAVPSAQVGGPADFVGPFLSEFLLQVRGAPLHHLTYHLYAPELSRAAFLPIAQVRAELAAAGRPASTPIYVTEWNNSSTLSIPPRLEHDGEEGATEYLEAVGHMAALGFDGQAYSSLQDFGPEHGPGQDPFKGNTGVVTKRYPVLRKSAMHAHEMVATMLNQPTLTVELTAAEQAAGVQAIATMESADVLHVLAWRHPRAVAAVLGELLEALGYASPAQWGLTVEQSLAFAAGTYELPANHPEPARTDLLTLRELARARAAAAFSTELSVDGLATTTVHVASINAGATNNAYRAFHAAGGTANHPAATAAALQESGALKVSQVPAPPQVIGPLPFDGPTIYRLRLARANP